MGDRIPLHFPVRAVLLACLAASLLLFPALSGAGDDTDPRSVTMSVDEAEGAVTRAYREVLHRDPDPEGMKTYADYLVKEGKSEEWLLESLAASPEAAEARARERARERADFRQRLLRVGVSAAAFAAAALVTVLAVLWTVKNERARVVAVNAAVVLSGAVALVLFFEWDLRSRHGSYNFFDAGTERLDFRMGRETVPEVFTTDPDMGYRPVVGPGEYYTEFGTVENRWGIEKTAGITRLLFIGDSVTHRGKIVDALWRRYGAGKFEYWNAGVESYNTIQEVAFYRKFNRRIEPDHVILTMVMNDLETTPLVYRSEGKLVLVAPRMPRRQINGRLFRHSLLYRKYVGWKTSRGKEGYREEVAADVAESLRSLKEELEREGILFTVILLPPLLDKADEREQRLRARYEDLVEIVASLGVRRFDLSEPLDEAIAAGVPLGEQAWDWVHPSVESAEYFSRYLWEKGIFGE